MCFFNHIHSIQINKWNQHKRCLFMEEYTLIVIMRLIPSTNALNLVWKRLRKGRVKRLKRKQVLTFVLCILYYCIIHLLERNWVTMVLSLAPSSVNPLSVLFVYFKARIAMFSLFFLVQELWKHQWYFSHSDETDSFFIMKFVLI